MCLLFYTIIIILSKVCVTEKKEEHGSYDMMGSFNNIKNKLNGFFNFTDLLTKRRNYKEKMDNKRKKNKKPFNEFIAEAFYDADTCNDSKNTNARSIMKLVKHISDESKMTALQLIASHGYQAETHTVYTKDEYKLCIHRVTPISQNLTSKTRNLVLLHHGLMGSSDDWLLLGQGKALPYLLSDSGYDVWLTNARGNKYSNSHAKISARQNPKEFWDFSFHEIGIYDLSAVIDYIRKRNAGDIHFVGHSMGGTALLVLLSTLPEYNKLMKSATLLAPLAFMFQIQGPILLLAKFYERYGRNSLNFLGENEFMPNQTYPERFIEKFCIITGSVLCLNNFLLLANGGKPILEQNTLKHVLGHVPAGTSAKTVRHYIQLVNSAQFVEYDYGAVGNMIKYNDEIPPHYSLSDVTLPVVLISSYQDWLCTTPNIITLLNHLPNVVEQHKVKSDYFSHTDFVWGEEAPILVFQFIKRFLSRPHFRSMGNVTAIFDPC